MYPQRTKFIVAGKEKKSRKEPFVGHLASGYTSIVGLRECHPPFRRIQQGVARSAEGGSRRTSFRSRRNIEVPSHDFCIITINKTVGMATPRCVDILVH